MMAHIYYTNWRLNLSLLMSLAWVGVGKASGDDAFLQEVIKAHSLLEKKCLQQVRIEESIVRYNKGEAGSPRVHSYLANSDSYLTNEKETGVTNGFVERIVVNRPDGRYMIGKRSGDEYVLGGITPPKSALAGFDASFCLAFPFCSIWTKGPLADLLSQKTTIFQVLKRDANGIEIEISQMAGDPQSPFHMVPLRIVLDPQSYAVKSIRGLQATHDLQVAIEAQYKDGFPSTITVKSGPNKDAMSVNRVHNFTIFRSESVNNTEFGLEQFGIPEPNSTYRGWFTMTRLAWFLGVGMLVLGGTVLGGRYLKRG